MNRIVGFILEFLKFKRKCGRIVEFSIGVRGSQDFRKIEFALQFFWDECYK